MEHVEHIAASWGPDAAAAGWRGPGFYWWDETGAYCHGPYDTEELAAKALADYADHLNRGANG